MFQSTFPDPFIVPEGLNADGIANGVRVTVRTVSGVLTVPLTWEIAPTDTNTLTVAPDGMSATVQYLTPGDGTVLLISDAVDAANSLMVTLNFVAKPAIPVLEAEVTPL